MKKSNSFYCTTFYVLNGKFKIKIFKHVLKIPKLQLTLVLNYII